LPVAGQIDSTWTEAFPPFHIAGNLYYVGTRALASYLVTTPNGLILINSDLEQNVPQIKASIEHLGFKFSDVKILLISHAHFDHDAGSARIKALTGAKYMVMDADVPSSNPAGNSTFSTAPLLHRSTLRPPSIASCTTATTSRSATQRSWRI
jgi:metallo-beta-lactamase class B